MSLRHREIQRGGVDGKPIWDTGSTLYDSYELASLQRILDSHLTGQPSPDEPLQKGPTPAGAPVTEGRHKQKQVVVFRARRKVTLRALFRGVASWAIMPRHPPACACVGVAPSSSAVGSEPAV